VDMGMAPGMGAGMALAPVFQYVHPADAEGRMTVGTIDIGAYELGGGTGGGGGGSSSSSSGTGGSASGTGGGASGTGGGASGTGGSASGTGGGASGTGGNPATSGSGTAGAGGGAGGAGSHNDTGDEGGCGCKIIRGEIVFHPEWAILAAGLVLALRRKRSLNRQGHE